MLELSDHKDAQHEIAVSRRTWCAGGLQGDRFLGAGRKTADAAGADIQDRLPIRVKPLATELGYPTILTFARYRAITQSPAPIVCHRLSALRFDTMRLMAMSYHNLVRTFDRLQSELSGTRI